MVTKVFEVRDNATNIGVIATKMQPEMPAEDYQLARNGFSLQGDALILVTKLSSSESSWDAFKWRDGTRTMFEAHRYIEEHFDELKTGDVIDVRYILGETDRPAMSDSYYSTLFVENK